MLFLLLTYVTQAELVDDFDGYELGPVNDVTTAWVGASDAGVAADSTASIVVDPVDSQNKVIQVTEGGGVGQQWLYRPLSATATIPDGTTSTMYVRFRATAEIDQSFGLTDVDTPGANWGDFRVQFVVHNGIQVRDGSSVRTLAWASDGTQVPFNADWYNLWIVVNNSTDTVTLYLNQTGEDATAANLLVNLANTAQSAFAFRSAAGDLDRFFWRAQNNTNTRLVMVDDINITPGVDLSVPPRLKPYSPEVVQGTPTGTSVPTTLKWKAGADPDGVYAVNPNIVNEYIFMGTDLDPNLLYVGATGIDPGTDDPDSEYSLSRSLDRTYYWAVVEAIDGYAQALTVGDSISLVDPNNIIGPTWSYLSTKSAPIINVQPADVRVFTTDPAAVFTVEFTSTVNDVTATWYKNDVPLTGNETDVSIVTAPKASSTLTIDTPTVADEGKYYCVLSVDEQTTEDDLQTATRLLTIKKELAKYEFEQNLMDTSGNNAPTGQGKSVAGQTGDPNELLATNVTLTYVPGIEGDAVSLDGSQYIDLGIEGYPKAGPLNTIGDIRGAGYEKSGFGRGMDQGSILCWIKPGSNAVVYSNANAADATHFALTTNGTDSARAIVRGNNFDDTVQNLGEASGSLQMTDFNLQNGVWHMFAATWADSTLRVYIDGEEVAANTQGYTEKYSPWEHSNVVGTSRTAANRIILNANDFLTGAIDSLRVYNYVISADDIAVEYETLSGNTPCANHAFDGNAYNFDNTFSSYCKIDLADFAVFAQNWLENGLYVAP